MIVLLQHLGVVLPQAKVRECQDLRLQIGSRRRISLGLIQIELRQRDSLPGRVSLGDVDSRGIAGVDDPRVGFVEVLVGSVSRRFVSAWSPRSISSPFAIRVR